MQETIQPGSARTLYAPTVTSRVTSQETALIGTDKFFNSSFGIRRQPQRQPVHQETSSESKVKCSSFFFFFFFFTHETCIVSGRSV